MEVLIGGTSFVAIVASNPDLDTVAKGKLRIAGRQGIVVLDLPEMTG
jgi:hypothetical protein